MEKLQFHTSGIYMKILFIIGTMGEQKNREIELPNRKTKPKYTIPIKKPNTWVFFLNKKTEKFSSCTVFN